MWGIGLDDQHWLPRRRRNGAGDRPVFDHYRPGHEHLAESVADDPCALVTPEDVASAFAASSASGEAGIARNCSFTIVDGVAASVEVFHYGSSSQWDGVKSGYEDNRGGVTDVPGIGDEAYQPNDVGPYEIVVRSGDVIFAVAVQTGTGGPEVEAAILDLAGVIAGG
jgi:hypothetical protein